MIKVTFKEVQPLVCRIDEGYSEVGYFGFALTKGKIKKTWDIEGQNAIILSEYFSIISGSNIKSIETVKPTDL